MKEITEKTLLPISLVIVVGGFIYWAAQIDSFVRAHEMAIGKVQAKHESELEVLLQVKADVSYIKQVLQEKKK